MRIGIDFDGVMNNMLTPWCEYLSSMSKIKANVQDIKYWDLQKTFTDLDKFTIQQCLKSPVFWNNVKPQPGAVDTIKQFINDGYDVVVITAAWPPESLSIKFNMCMQKHFPFINWKNVISTGRKDLIDIDILIDDNPVNLVESHSATKLLYCYPYNEYAQNYNYLTCVKNWKEIKEVVYAIS